MSIHVHFRLSDEGDFSFSEISNDFKYKSYDEKIKEAVRIRELETKLENNETMEEHLLQFNYDNYEMPVVFLCNKVEYL